MGLTEQQKFVVRVSCSTFNHANYITDAMNGFTMQETNFPYVCTIFDDASTDGNQEVIKKYLQEHFEMNNEPRVRKEENDDYVLILAQHKINRNCLFAVFFLKYNHYSIEKSKNSYIKEWMDNSKYIAICEGDDYWTDPAKLQKQIDFLDAHPDYTMCFHAALEQWVDNIASDLLFRLIEDRDYPGIEIYKDWTVATASVVMRRKIFHSEVFESALKNHKFIFSDIVLFLSCAAYGKIYGMSDVMSVYRRHEGSAVFDYSIERQIKQAYHSLEIYKVFGDEYKVLSKDKFFHHGMEAFLNAKGKGNIHYGLLRDLIFHTPKKTFTYFWAQLIQKMK